MHDEPRRELPRQLARESYEQGVSLMYAVIKTGGKQYKVAPGEKLKG